jgi:hypothetical protein
MNNLAVTIILPLEIKISTEILQEVKLVDANTIALRVHRPLIKGTTEMVLTKINIRPNNTNNQILRARVSEVDWAIVLLWQDVKSQWAKVVISIRAGTDQHSDNTNNLLTTLSFYHP